MPLHNCTAAADFLAAYMKTDPHLDVLKKEYAAVSADVLNAADGGYCAMKYADGTSAAVAYDGSDYKAFTMGFPIECIKDAKTKSAILRGIMAFILK